MTESKIDAAVSGAMKASVSPLAIEARIAEIIRQRDAAFADAAFKAGEIAELRVIAHQYESLNKTIKEQEYKAKEGDHKQDENGKWLRMQWAPSDPPPPAPVLEQHDLTLPIPPRHRRGKG